jgi:hypothetical protein
MSEWERQECEAYRIQVKEGCEQLVAAAVVHARGYATERGEASKSQTFPALRAGGASLVKGKEEEPGVPHEK